MALLRGTSWVVLLGVLLGLQPCLTRPIPQCQIRIKNSFVMYCWWFPPWLSLVLVVCAVSWDVFRSLAAQVISSLLKLFSVFL